MPTSYDVVFSLYGLCILLSGIFNLLLPFSITFLGYGVACSIRFIQGLSEVWIGSGLNFNVLSRNSSVLRERSDNQ